MINPLLQLKAQGQSVWLDDIDRGQLRSGLFGRLINADGITGATGNPPFLSIRSVTIQPTMSRCSN
jgi:transaldolase